MKQRRLLFLLSRFLDGGIDTVLVNYLRYLAAHTDYRITLAIGTSMDELEVFSNDLPDTVKGLHLVDKKWLTRWRQEKIRHNLPRHIKLYDELILTPIRRYMIQRKINRLAKSHDVIIDFDCCFYSFLRHIDTPKVAWYHFSIMQALVQRRHRTNRLAKFLQNYNKVVVISKAMLNEGKWLFPELAEKFYLIYNTKDAETIQQQAHDKSEYDERMGHPYILAVERLEESQKDITTLLKAYTILREEYNRTEPLYIMGKGLSENDLRQKARDLGLDDDEIFIGFHNNPYPWMLHATMMVHSAHFEGLPTMLIEGLMLDKLMVATDCPTGPREILDEGRAGLLIPVGDAQVMAESMHRMLTDTQLQETIHQGIKKHRNTFSSETMLQCFNQMIEEITSN